MDYASRYAEKSERMIELRLRKLYREAQKDLEAKFRKFTETKARRDREMRKKLEDGKISDQDYKDWLKGQAFIGERWKAKINQATESLLHANEEAMAIVRGEQFNVFAESANFEAYSIEKHYGGAVSFDIYDTDTVQMLVRDKPSLLPPRKVNGKKDRAWNQGIISNCVAQGIIQGESMDKIAQRIAHDTANSDMKAMMRYARTAVTAARNMGSLETMDRASKMGIKLKKQWIATLDGKTRDSHRHLDGETVDFDKPFKSDYGEIRCPGDPQASPADVYNCRCDMITVYPEYAEFEEDWRKDEVIDGQTYEEWKEGKKNSEEAIFGSAYGVVKKTSKYNEKVYQLREEISKLDKEYQELYIRSLTSFGKPEYNDIVSRLSEVEKEISTLREKAVEIEADRARYLSEVGEKDITKMFGKIQGKHNAAIDAKSVNVVTSDVTTQNNCGSCVLAFDARRRGIDCEALPSYGTNNGQVETWWQGIKIKPAASYWGSDAREEIRATASTWGEGARGIVQIYWTPLSGHYMAFEVVNGKCVFFDPQTGVMNADNVFDGALPGYTMYARTDDKPLTKAAVFGIKGKNK